MKSIRGVDFIGYMEVSGNEPVIICYAKDFQINRTYELKEISGPQSRYRQFIYDMISYTLQIPALVSWTDKFNYLDFANAGEKGLTLKWKASSYKNGGVVLSGEVLINELDLTSQMRDMINLDASFTGTGELITDILPIKTTVYLSDFDKIELPGCPDPYPLVVFWYDKTMIGIATNADDVISIFNEYSMNNGGLYILTSSVDGGCNFNMDISFEADEPYPTTIFAKQGGAFAISNDQTNNFVISPDQNNDEGLTPLG